MSDTADQNLAPKPRSSSGLQQLIGYKIVERQEGRAVIDYDVAADHLNRNDSLHGGIIATLCDTAAGACGAYSAASGELRSSVTLSLTVNFVSSVSRGRLTATGRKRGGGKSIFFSEVEVHDEEGRLIATATGTFRYMSATARKPTAE